MSSVISAVGSVLNLTSLAACPMGLVWPVFRLLTPINHRRLRAIVSNLVKYTVEAPPVW